MERVKVKYQKSTSHSIVNTAMESLWGNWDLTLNEFECERAFRILALNCFELTVLLDYAEGAQQRLGWVRAKKRYFSLMMKYDKPFTSIEFVGWMTRLFALQRWLSSAQYKLSITRLLYGIIKSVLSHHCNMAVDTDPLPKVGTLQTDHSAAPDSNELGLKAKRAFRVWIIV